MSEPRKSATPLKAQSDKRREDADERRKEKATEHPQREPGPDTLEGPATARRRKGRKTATRPRAAANVEGTHARCACHIFINRSASP